MKKKKCWRNKRKKNCRCDGRALEKEKKTVSSNERQRLSLRKLILNALCVVVIATKQRYICCDDEEKGEREEERGREINWELRTLKLLGVAIALHFVRSFAFTRCMNNNLAFKMLSFEKLVAANASAGWVEDKTEIGLGGSAMRTNYV